MPLEAVVAGTLVVSEHSDIGQKIEGMRRQASKHRQVIANKMGWMAALKQQLGKPAALPRAIA